MGVRYILLYDGDCGVCSFFAAVVKRLDLGGRIEPVPLAASRADRWFVGVSEDDRFASFHIVRPPGDRASRGRGLVAVIEALPLGRGLAKVLSAQPWALEIADRVYDRLARYRGFLAGIST